MSLTSCSFLLALVKREKWLDRNVSNQNNAIFIPKGNDTFPEKMLDFDAGIMDLPVTLHDPP